ncbi:hypothetical protein BJP36_42010 [Moorena producens JHB]|uniref:Uncharacterized protein n=1 Tax=Moorena producens (strain JHB) TaxID=1454205 RepID=A0A9Q9SSP9_MOOP1|nr:hypothetical protein [Moorena producens]WAN68936.1 hypothetical protein BJP36_42010 [Moorena producens JHB]
MLHVGQITYPTGTPKANNPITLANRPRDRVQPSTFNFQPLTFNQ